jgi:hypothetical protein
MNPIQIVENLYVNKKSTWIIELEDTDIEPFVIQHFLSMNDAMRVQVRWLDKYVFTLPPKMWLSLAWSVIPKYPKQPFVPYIKKTEQIEEHDFILKEIRKQFKLSDNDYNSMRTRLIAQIKNDMPLWFKYYGIQKKYWKQYHLSFDYIKHEDKKVEKTIKSLGAWGL